MLNLSVGRVLVEVPRAGCAGTVVGRIDPHTGERIRVHTGNAGAGTGCCGRFTISGRLVYYCRMTPQNVQTTKTLFAANGASNFSVFRNEDQMGDDILRQTASAIRTPSFDELKIAVADLIVDNPETWGAQAVTAENGELQAFYVFRAVGVFDPETREIVDGGIDCWNLMRLGDPSDPWRVPYPEHWSPARCEVRNLAEEELLAYLTPTLARLRGVELAPPTSAEWRDEAWDNAEKKLRRGCRRPKIRG